MKNNLSCKYAHPPMSTNKSELRNPVRNSMQLKELNKKIITTRQDGIKVDEIL